MLAPVLQRLVPFSTFRRLSLPQREVAKLNRQRIELGRLARYLSLIARGQFFGQNAQRPTVGGDMMERDQEPPFLLVESKQARPQHEIRRQVEGPAPFLRRHAFGDSL